MISNIDTFKTKLELWISQIKKKDLKHFLNLKHEIESNSEICDYQQFGNILEHIFQQFQRRFVEFEELRPITSFLSSPFSKINIENIAVLIGNNFNLDEGSLEMQLIELQSDISLKSRDQFDVWNSITIKLLFVCLLLRL